MTQAHIINGLDVFRYASATAACDPAMIAPAARHQYL
jgi:hypothetical protein